MGCWQTRNRSIFDKLKIKKIVERHFMLQTCAGSMLKVISYRHFQTLLLSKFWMLKPELIPTKYNEYFPQKSTAGNNKHIDWIYRSKLCCFLERYALSEKSIVLTSKSSQYAYIVDRESDILIIHCIKFLRWNRCVGYLNSVISWHRFPSFKYPISNFGFKVVKLTFTSSNYQN